MGRFVHEAVAVDPATGRVYETEDAGSSGLYRFTPVERGRLSAGGSLDMLMVKGMPRFDTRKGLKPGATFSVEWASIDQPQRAHVDKSKVDGMGVFQQGFDKGGAVFARLEGAWYRGGSIFFVSTNGGNQQRGQVWEYKPADETLRLVFESPGYDILDMPDNICVSPRGGLALCDDRRFVRVQQVKPEAGVSQIEVVLNWGSQLGGR